MRSKIKKIRQKFVISFLDETTTVDLYENDVVSQSPYPSKALSKKDTIKSSLSKSIKDIKQLFTSAKKKLSTFSFKTVLRRARYFFSVINRNVDNPLQTMIESVQNFHLVERVQNFFSKMVDRQGGNTQAAGAILGLGLGTLTAGLAGVGK